MWNSYLHSPNTGQDDDERKEDDQEGEDESDLEYVGGHRSFIWGVIGGQPLLPKRGICVTHLGIFLLLLPLF